MTHGFSLQHPLIVKREGDINDDPENKGMFVVVDGMHRVTAMSEILAEQVALQQRGESLFSLLDRSKRYARVFVDGFRLEIERIQQQVYSNELDGRSTEHCEIRNGLDRAQAEAT